MDFIDKIEKEAGVSIHKDKVHHILAHSYMFYFIAFLFSLILDFIFPLKILDQSVAIPLGTILLLFSAWLVFWAQKSSHKLEKENITKETFCRGPYCYTRSPTHLGLFLMILGFGFLTNSFFITFFAILSFITTKFTFLNKQEKILTEKYGAPYAEYKKSVRF